MKTVTLRLEDGVYERVLRRATELDTTIEQLLARAAELPGLETSGTTTAADFAAQLDELVTRVRKVHFVASTRLRREDLYAKALR